MYFSNTVYVALRTRMYPIYSDILQIYYLNIDKANDI